MKRETAPPKLTGVRHHSNFIGRADHDVIQLRFQDIRRGKPLVDIQAIHREEEVIGVQLLEHSLGLGAYE